MENKPTPKNAPVLITGSGGFIGKNLTVRLRAEGYANLLLYDVASPEGALEEYAREAAFVFHLAGVNRPKDKQEFYAGNADLTARLLAALAAAGNTAPVVLSSSAQAGNGTEYALSKEQAEAAVFAHALQTGAPVYVYRLPGVFGKWSRPAYNSVVATFCHNIAHGLPIEVRDPGFELALCYIDDVTKSFLGVLDGGEEPPAPGRFMGISPVHKMTLGCLAEMIRSFKASRATLAVPDMGDAFCKKLYATWLSYLPTDAFGYELATHEDARGSFTEVLRTPERGQVSVNVTKPGVVRGNHWHNTKNEKFLVVAGEGVIRFRRLLDDAVLTYPVSGARPQVVDIPTGYTHNIQNTGTADLVTLMWASEPFDPANPDTYPEEV